jgi:hypothetical protein
MGCGGYRQLAVLTTTNISGRKCHPSPHFRLRKNNNSVEKAKTDSQYSIHMKSK